MIRGTTPKLNFKLPFNVSILNNLYITFNQNNKTLLEKTLNDCVLKGNVVAISLSQEETLSFSAKENIEIQLRAKTIEGDALASNIIITSVGEILKEGVI